MPKLLDAVETEFSTDFAILMAAQSGMENVAASFASSTQGFVGMQCGTKYSRVLIRAERWDARPPLIEGWEDSDDLPFEEVPAAGDLALIGFEVNDVALEITGFGRGRVQVFARGRHRYHYSSTVNGLELAPEEWLLRLYPQDGPVDPMAGGPRRIAGGDEMSRSANSPWQAAILGFRTSGWQSALAGSHGFYLADLALSRVDAPVTRLELASRMAGRMPPWTDGGPDAESTEVPPRPSLGGEPDPLALLSGQDSVRTIGLVIDALVGIGLLLVEERSGRHLLVPNPSPEPAWERLNLSGAHLVSARAAAMESEHRAIASDIAFAVNWVGEDGLTSTPRTMAIRWSTTVEDVIGGVRLLAATARVNSDRQLDFDTEVSPDASLTLWPTDPAARVSI